MAADDLEVRLAWGRAFGRGRIADRWLDVVLRRHREPHRHYHGVRHVAWVLRHVGELDDRLADRDAVVAAACFHDVVYEPTAPPGRNEAASAALAAEALTELGWDVTRIDHVVAMVAATAHHDADHDADGDTRVLLAADLAVLATDPGRYGDYVRAVRREYAHVDEQAWRTGRAGVLRSLLDRARLFAPELGLDDWERRARANMTAELADLER